METLTRDFKRLVPGTGVPDRAELAKDIAAFANRIGGVLILGAVEDRKRGVLGAYTPVGAEQAKAIRDACSHVVRDLCSPQPIFEAARIAKARGFVVVVNVWPFPGQAVGARRAGDSDAWTFPMRTGTDCTYLRPEQLPMLMIPELRRVIALLYSIPPGQLVGWNYRGGRDDTMRYTFDGVDEETNVAKFRNLGGGTPFTIPLDFIRSVWRDEAGVWHVTGIASLSPLA